MEKYLQELGLYTAIVSSIDQNELTAKGLRRITENFIQSNELEPRLEDFLERRLQRLEKKELSPAEYVEAVKDQYYVLDLVYIEDNELSGAARNEKTNQVNAVIQELHKSGDSERANFLQAAQFAGIATAGGMNGGSRSVSTDMLGDKNSSFGKRFTKYAERSIENNFGSEDLMVIRRGKYELEVPITMSSENDGMLQYVNQAMNIGNNLIDFIRHVPTAQEAREWTIKFVDETKDIDPRIREQLVEGVKILDEQGLKAFNAHIQRLSDGALRGGFMDDHFGYNSRTKDGNVAAAEALKEYEPTGNETTSQKIELMRKMVKGLGAHIEGETSYGRPILVHDGLDRDDMLEIKKLAKKLGADIDFDNREGLKDMVNVTIDDIKYPQPATIIRTESDKKER